MNRTMLAFAGLAGLGACVDTGVGAPLRIIGNVAPADGCVVDPGSTTFQDDGVIDADSPIGYVLTPAVRNDLVAVEGEAISPKTIYITHARVELAFYDPAFADVTSDASLLSFSVPVSGSVEPNGGLSGFSFEITPPELMRLVGDRLGPPTADNPIPRTALDARVQMFGTRGGGGSEEDSNVFRYPVEICNGCTVVDRGPCANLPSGFQASTGGACNTLQDGVLDCCDNFTVCPAAEPGS